MITTFRTFENKELDKIKNFQDIKLSVLKFTKILQNLFLNYYKVNLKFHQEDSPLGIIETYDLRLGGNILCKIYIGFDKTYKVTLNFFIWNNHFTSFYKFVKEATEDDIKEFNFQKDVKNFNL